MGYTHYWRRPREVEMPVMVKIVDDFKKLLPAFGHAGIKLANGNGQGKPKIDYAEVWFNGSRHCGHPENKTIAITWPSKNASGIARPGEQVVSGYWFAGVEIAKRICDGDCSFETFSFPRVITDKYCKSSLIEDGKYFSFCKTAFRPYDLAVICFLIIAKHYLGDKIIVSSDGTNIHWFDGIVLCEYYLHYSAGYVLEHLSGKDETLTGS